MSSEANEVVDVAVGAVKMLDLDRDFIFRSFAARRGHAAAATQYYAWPDFVREALLAYAGAPLPELAR